MARSKIVFALLCLLMFLAPLFRSGKVPSALLVLELIALLILVVIWWNRFTSVKIGRAQLAALLGLLVLPILYFMPVPAILVELLPGYGDYRAAQLYAAPAAEPLFAYLSLFPRESLSGWLVLLLPFATYLAARSLDTAVLRTLLGLLFVITGLQAVLGLIQFGTGPDSPFYVGMKVTHFGSAVGTYTSRNNYVGLLYMALMVSLALVIANVGLHRRKVGQQTLRQRLVYLSTAQGHKAFLLGAFSLLILLAVVFSRSRAGISLTIIGILLVSMSMSRRLGGGNVRGLTGTMVLLTVGFGVSIGLAPVLDRFSARDPLSDGRWRIFEGTFQGIAQFFPLGSGAATFRETFPAFQDISQAGYTINQAHNDYLEWIYTGGVPAGILVLCFLGIYFLRWPRLWQKAQWGEFRYIQVGAGIGMLLMLLHELVDYNLFIPANMIFFSFLAALFFHDYKEPEANRAVDRRRERRGGIADRMTSPEVSMPTELQPVAGGVPTNPFMDE